MGVDGWGVITDNYIEKLVITAVIKAVITTPQIPIYITPVKKT